MQNQITKIKLKIMILGILHVYSNNKNRGKIIVVRWMFHVPHNLHHISSIVTLQRGAFSQSYLKTIKIV